jgi:putative PEP-CTERM system histidine kinase
MGAGWHIFSELVHFAGACAAATLAIWLLGRRERFGAAGLAIIVALATTSSWALAITATGSDSAAADLAESFRNLAWLFVVYRLFADDGRHALVRPIRPLIAALALIELLLSASLLLNSHLIVNSIGRDTVFQTTATFRMMLTIGGLVLLHNLYGGASPRARLTLRWPTTALALMWLYDLNLYTVAYLSGSWPGELATLRGLILLVVVALLIPGATLRRDELRFSPSRAVTFEMASLVGIGLYFLGMVMLAKWLAYVGGDFARLLQFGFLIAASALALLALPSKRMRGWLKVTLVKHLFQHRFDYRAEWLRFTRTIGRGGEAALPLQERAIQAVAEITDSQAGLLLIPGDHGELQLAGRWQWPRLEVPACAMSAAAVSFFERDGFIVELDSVRIGAEGRGELDIVPAWLVDETQAWALVPLLHYERLTGVIVLARPPHTRKLDWEDFDLLRVVGQQLASYLAEHAGQDALAEVARFDEFNRRIAFVMHDIKNLASQFSLLARNAEHHAENPAFRADMIVTLMNSAEKLNALIARLSRYGSGSRETLANFDVGEVVRQVVAQFDGNYPVAMMECRGGEITANRESLEQALVHLIQNAIDASKTSAPVFVRQTTDGIHARIEVIDSGHGMSPEFIRTRLFKPFVSSKPGGFGIGAFEARELIRAMNGRLDVESREGLGSRFLIRLPLTTAMGLLKSFDRSEQKVA